MNNYTNAINRLQEYINLLNNNNARVQIDLDYSNLDDDDDAYGLSMADISDMTSIPIQIIRNDFSTIFEWQFSLGDKERSFNNPLFEINQNFSFFFASEDDSDESNIDVLQKKIKEGTLDNTPLTVYTFDDSTFRVELTPAEAQALNSLKLDNNERTLYQKFWDTYENSFLIKDSYLYSENTSALFDNIDAINQAISNKNTVKIDYRLATSKQQFEFIPLKLVFDATDNTYYVLSIIEHLVYAFRLDRIQRCTASKSTIPYPDKADLELLDIYPQVWGCSFGDKPIKVKACFKNVANVWSKVRNELACRTCGRLYEKDELLCYEDTVYGINKFRSWIFQYGRAVKVIKPKKLKDEIVESLKIRAEMYGILKN